MSWDSVILETSESGSSLASAVERLFDSQRDDWKQFQEGEAALSALRRKRLTVDGQQVIIQANPGRRRSTLARTDAKSVAARNCFLCPQNMPSEERGIAYGSYVILPNPYPVLGRHCTIPHREHRPQRIKGQVGAMFDLARGLGPEMVVFYNGPRCGASAPDHLHFQACEAKEVPLLNHSFEINAGEEAKGHERCGSRYVSFESHDPLACQDKIEGTIDLLGRIVGDLQEPMVNILIQYNDERCKCIVFPRAAHRPACYFKEGTDHLAISPAALEMAGILVVSEPEHFERVSVEAVQDIYSEVSLDATRFSHLVELIE